MASLAVLGLTAPLSVGRSLTSLIAGNSTFAFDLYHAVSEQGGNLFLSPYSVSEALAMTYAGAVGETEEQMEDVLHFYSSSERLHMSFRSLRAFLLSQDRFLSDPYAIPFELSVANRLWGQAGYGFLPEYLALLEMYYAAGLAETDFFGDPEGARLTINGWVSDQTKAKIPELIPQGLVTSDTTLVLTNAVYFNASWKHLFMEDATQDGAFHLASGTEIQVPMMRQLEELLYTRDQGYQLVELPYANSAMAMTILIPDQGAFDAVEAKWDANAFAEMVEAMQTHLVELTMPRFSFRRSFALAETLSAMGMDAAIGSGADFSGMDGTDRLFISEVMHEAFVDVSEKGTEAAAATAVMMGGGGAPGELPPIVELAIDRPFLFVIRDTETGTILFTGRVMDPSA